MAGEVQNRRGVKRELSVVGLLIELKSDSDDESEEYNDSSVLMEIAVSRQCTSTIKVGFSNIAYADASNRHETVRGRVGISVIFFQFVRQFHALVFLCLKYISDYTLGTLINLAVH